VLVLVRGGLSSHRILPVRRSGKGSSVRDSVVAGVAPPLAWPSAFELRYSSSKYSVWWPVPPPGACAVSLRPRLPSP
jgi:hypothetical protein